MGAVMNKRQQITDDQLKDKPVGYEQRLYTRSIAEDKRLQEEYQRMVREAHWLMLAFMLSAFLCVLIYASL
jgi:hypothetical protein